MFDKYSDRKNLSEYDLCVDLFEQFNLKVNDAVPARSVYLISTDKGNKVLKKVEYSIEELNFIYEALQYIKNEFSRVIDYVKTKDGEIYTVWNNDIYCILNLVEGIECDFSNPIDVSAASIGLSEMHKASEGYKGNLENRCPKGKLINKFKRRVQELEFFRYIAEMHDKKNEFDNIFLSNANYYTCQMEKSINILEKSAYLKLCSEEDKKIVCHHDLANRNILIKDNEAYFIDFDYAILDLRVHDLCNFINKVIKNFAFDMEKAEGIINDYSSQNALEDRELEVLFGMLYFPEDFYGIASDYYTKRKDWDEETFLERLVKKVNYKDDRSEFLQLFEEKYCNKG